jgi:dihydrofolate reductase/thymidylate synthase
LNKFAVPLILLPVRGKSIQIYKVLYLLPNKHVFISRLLEKMIPTHKYTRAQPKQMSYSIIVAGIRQSVDSIAIGNNGTIPWNCPVDMLHFRNTTTEAPEGWRNVVVMGRKTWESIPANRRPLKGRYTVVLTRSPEYDLGLGANIGKDVCVLTSLSDLVTWFDAVRKAKKFHHCFIAGGGDIYRQVLEMGICSRLFLTEIIPDQEGMGRKMDTFVTFNPDEWETKQMINLSALHSGKRERGKIGENVDVDKPEITNNGNAKAILFNLSIANRGEKHLLETMKRIVEEGTPSPNRTGVAARYTYGERFEYDLRGGRFPLLTTRRAFPRGIFEELMWFLRGQTDASILQEKKVHVWDGNSTREFLDEVGLVGNREGDIGAGYGFQLRHFGAEYKGCDADYDGKGRDQLAALVEGIRHTPLSRRHVVSFWNPTEHLAPTADELGQGWEPSTALPPCHMQYHWNVNPDEKTIECCFFQRSSDLFLAGSWNACSAALWTYLLGWMTGYEPKKVVMMTANTHVYDNHREQVLEQCRRIPTAPPLLRIAPKRDIRSITDFEWEDLEILNYRPQPAIRGKMN